MPPPRALSSDKTILLLGGAIVDIVLALDRLPRSGEDVYAEFRQSNIGGCAPNVSRVLAQLGLRHDLLVPVGKGIYADLVRRQFLEDGREILVVDPSGDCGWCLSLVEKGGERSFVSVAGLESHWRPEWFNRVRVETYDYIYLSGYDVEGESGPVILDALERRHAGAKIVFDGGPRIGYLTPTLLDRLLRPGTLFHTNRMEIATLTKEKDVVLGAEKVYARTGEPVVITLDADGALVYTDRGGVFVRVSRAAVVDSIGAGDAHTGGFIAGLAAGMPPEQACALGNEIAAVMVQQQGSRIDLRAWLAPDG